MAARFLKHWMAFGALSLLWPWSTGAQQPPLATVLARTADYVADYSKRLAAIVAEEDYRQQVISSSRRGQGIMGMLFFDRLNQPMSEFKRVESGNVKALAKLATAADIWTVEFKETQPGTMVRGARGRDVPSHGRAWIDSTTGRILRTEHISADTFVRGEIDVTYRTEAGLDLLVPGEMREAYVVIQQNVVINGHATYSRFRQFTVTTTEKPKPQ